jgi:hypothetical protein
MSLERAGTDREVEGTMFLSELAYCSTLKMKASHYFETSGTHTTYTHILEENILGSYCRESPKPHY